MTSSVTELRSAKAGILLYLASPYSHLDPDVREARFRAACVATAKLLRRGVHVFSPIVHSFPMVGHGLPGDWTFWQAYDRLMLSRCDELAVLCLDGWKESVGVQAEIAIAEELSLPVRFIDPHSFAHEERITHACH